MGFFKKLVKGVANVVKGVTNVVSKATGFAAKILPSPLGGIAKTVSAVTGGVSGFASKLLDSSPGKMSPTQAPAAQAAAFNQGIAGGQNLTIDLSGKNWFQRNMAWVIPVGAIVLGFFMWLIFGNKKRR